MLRLRRPRIGALNLVLLTVLVTLAGGGAWLVFGTSDATTSTSAATATATRTNVSSSVSADGTVAPTSSTDVSFDADGTVSRILVEVGDQVNAGDVLAYAHDSTAALKVASAEAGYKSAKANREAVEEATEDDAKTTDDERDRQRSSAKAQVAQAKVSLAEARQNLSDLTLRAPVSGTVTAVNGTVGESPNGGGNDGNDDQSANAFLTIADLGTWVVECDFAEADVAKVNEGDDVEITFGAVPNETFTGRVRAIDLTATSSENVTTYGVEVDVLNAPSELRDGASANVTVTTASADDVLAVPTSAVTTDTNGDSTVQLVKDGKTQARTVSIGIKGDTYTEITSGLAEGDTVELGATSTSSNSRGDSGPRLSQMGGAGGPMMRGPGG